jgi:hypothetical protein
VFANGSPNEVFMNQGAGAFAAAPALGNADSRGVAIADFDGDGLPDLAFANADGASQVYRNTGGGTFAAPVTVANEPMVAVAAADVDGDGAVDLVFGRATATPPDVPGDPVYRNTSTLGAISFGLAHTLGAAPTSQALVADFNEDGAADALVLNATGTHQVFLGGGGTLTLHAQQFATAAPNGAAIGDFNNDGRPDVVVATGAGLDVFLNAGSANLGQGDTVAPTIQLNGPASMTLAQGTAFTDLGATATDAIDGDLTNDIETNNPVNVDAAGDYTVTYVVWDRSGNKAQATRGVTVTAAARSGGGGGAAGYAFLAGLLCAALVRARNRRKP